MSTYFSDQTFRFQRALARHNEREWFHAHKADYEAHLRQPFLHLIADLQAPLAKLSAHFVADPRPVGGSLFRIHRDTRFSKDKTPYKPWAGARLYHQRSRETEAPSFYIHIAPGDSFVGGGLWHPGNPTTRRVRSFIADNPSTWQRFTHAAKFREHCNMVGDTLVRPPAGFPADHPLIEDLKRKDFVAVCALDDALVTGPKLIPAIAERLTLVAPLIDYLCAALDLEY
ncbi:MAG: DUF2461 domain-containing protein [Xanthomonadaceae bacterium]|nr:DUF2461 domain-containing protein [Xanthomonadaceae bacterium]